MVAHNSLLNKGWSPVKTQQNSCRDDQLDGFILYSTEPFIRLFVPFSFIFLPSLPLCNLFSATGSFPFLTGCSRFWKLPRRMRVPTAVLHPILPGRTSVMKPGSLLPQVRPVAMLFSIWKGSQAPLGAAMPITKLKFVLYVWNYCNQYNLNLKNAVSDLQLVLRSCVWDVFSTKCSITCLYITLFSFPTT